MRLILLSILVLVTFLFSSSCKKHGPADEAFFIRASDVRLKTGSGQGSSSQKITDLWLYVNGQYQGAYPVGNLMPIISKGDAVRINIFAGIKNNGISETRIFWPFYDILTFDTLVESGKVIERPFTFQYKSATTFTLNEDFESSATNLIKSSNSTKGIETAPAADAFEGKSGMLALDGSIYYAQVESTKEFELPIGSSNVYLELNYKCNVSFEIGLLGSSGEHKSIIAMNEQDTWNKTYIQLSEAVSSSPVSSSYKLYFSMSKPITDTDTKKVFLDNVKLVYLQ